MYYQVKARIDVATLSEFSIDNSSYFENVTILIISTPTIVKITSVQTFLNFLNSRTSGGLSLKFITPEVPLEEVDSIVKEIQKPDKIIAIGGGSAIDAAKLLSVCWDGINGTQLFRNEKALPKFKIPVLAIPTTAGTGAELSFGAIVSDTEKGKKGGVRSGLLQPDHVLIDYQLYNNAPKKLKAETGFDCLTHAIETYCSLVSSPIIKYQSVNAIQTVFSHLRNAIEGDCESMQKMAISSCLMGLNLAYSSTCLPHRIQYVIGPDTGTSHAQGLIMLYRGWLKEISKENIINELTKDLGLSANKFTESIIDLKKDLEIDYRLSDYGIKENQVSEIAKKVTGNVQNDPSYKGIYSIEKIIYNSI